MKNGKKGISFIEVIVSVAILVIISVVAVTTHTSMVDKTNNSKIVSDMTSLENSLSSYKNDTSKIPTPNGNLKYFKEDTSYAHDITDAFAVSGFVTEKTIPKKYINYLPLDPKTGQYYALSTTKDESSFEIAGIVKNNESYKSKVSGNWSGESGPYNLIREYNGPNFVYDDATESFPYNPEELLLTAKISDYSGSILINSKNYTKDEILSLDLREGDKIEVGTGSSAEMYLSDGSYSTLGDVYSKTEVVLANMRYVEENNLFTSVKIALNMGSIWTKASSLGEKSDYEIYTTDTVASVRGTIFGVNANSTKSNVVVIQGEVEVKKINSIPDGNNFDNLTRAIENDKIDEIVSENVGEIPGVTNGSGVIVVEKGEDPKAVEVIDSPSAGTRGGTREISGTGVIEKIPKEGKEKIENNLGEINNSIRLEILELSNTGDIARRYVKIALTDTLKKGNIVKINDNKYEWSLTGSFLLINGTPLREDIVKIAICKNKKCTRELKVDFTKKISFKKDVLDDTKTDEDLDSSCDRHMLENGVCNYDYKLTGIADYDEHFEMKYLTGTTTGILTSSKGFLNSDVCAGSDSPGTNELCYQKNSGFLKQKNITSDSSLYSFSGGITGVYLDNINNDDYLKYNISSLDLNSGSGFAIEMSVRGGALNRSSGYYYLLGLSDGGYNFNQNSLGFGLKNGDFGVNAGSFSNYISLSNINVLDNTKSSLDSNSFYLIRIEIYPILNKLSFYINNQKISEDIIINGYLQSNFNNIRYLNIGGPNHNFYQWNDIIDYIKIYKK